MSDTFFIGNRQSRLAWADARKKYMKRGHMTMLQIAHDDFCTVFKGENYCNCNPTRVLKDSYGRILATVENVGSDNPMEFFGSGQHD